MKKSLIILSLVLILVLLLASAGLFDGFFTKITGKATWSCTETDDGQDYFVKGKTIVGFFGAWDKCMDTVQLKEYYCDANGERQTELFSCEFGCVDGACLFQEEIPEEPPPEEPPAEPQCTDTDSGIDYNVKGKVTVGTFGAWDICQDSTQLKEYFCQDDIKQSQIYACPYGCTDGKCNPQEEEPVCTDTDGGKDYEVQGKVTVGSFGTKDLCNTEIELKEYYCDSGKRKSENVNCQFGCLTGACLPQGTYLGDERKLNYLKEGFGTYHFPYFENYNLDEYNPQITHAVIVIHGTSRNADSYFDSVMEASEMQDMTAESMIIAPHFYAQDEDDEIPANTEYWKYNSGWKSGYSSEKNKISSFAIVDEFVEKLNDKTKFPNLKQIVITGHSAGGQFTNRYAAGSQYESAVPIKFVVANPSSYLYFHKERWVREWSWSKFKWVVTYTKPDTITCPTYNQYKYGLEDLNTYMKQSTESELKTRYQNQEVVYLLGTNDILKDENLDQSCSANLQGDVRLERGYNYIEYLEKEFDGVEEKHSITLVPGAGHSAGQMYKSAAGSAELFF